MATKRQIVDDPNSCWNKAKDDEPIFVLRAQDLLSPAIVDVWAQLAGMHGASQRKIDGAVDTAAEMRGWDGFKKWPT